VMLGFLLHDIGKAESAEPAVWDLRNDQLTEPQWHGMRQHVAAGEALLARYEALYDLELPAVVHDILLYHHEKLDGSGRHAQLNGEHIPFFGRLATVVDQIIGRCEDRSYHVKSYTLREAFEEVYSKRGELYDDQILENFLNIFLTSAHLKVSGLGWLGSWYD